MSLIASLFLLSTTAAAQAHDGNPSGEWLPIPDGYVWPLSTENAPTFDPELHLFADLSDTRRKVLARIDWPNGELPKEVTIAEADLNSDGENELFVHNPVASGSGGRFYDILTPTNRGYRFVGGFQGFGIKFVERKNGWFQIEATSRAGSRCPSRHLLTFVLNAYDYTRSEIHDFNTGEVTVRETESEQDATDQAAAVSESKSCQDSEPSP